MRRLYILNLILMLCMAMTSCTDDLTDFAKKECVVGDPEFITLDLSDGSFDDVTITTRATSDGQFEHLVKTFYVFIFKDDAVGKKVYGKYFDINNKTAWDNLTDAQECWSAVPASPALNEAGEIIYDENGNKVLGKHNRVMVRIKAPTGGPYKIYVVTNFEAAYLKLSPELFETFTCEEDLLNAFLNFDGNPIHRTSMLMTGMVENVMLYSNGTAQAGGVDIKYNDDDRLNTAIRLRRIDAKIDVRINVDPLKQKEQTASNEVVNNPVKDFIPVSWEVINLTNRTKLIDEYNENGGNFVVNEAENKKEYYFNTIPMNFESIREKTISSSDGRETKKVNQHCFSFYMLENHQKPKKWIADNDYHKRDLRTKINGEYDKKTGDMWENAPQYGTYLKITGQVIMDYNEKNLNTGDPQTLHADVVYYIHLGDFTSKRVVSDAALGVNNKEIGVNNYDVNRNTRYTYNISIIDVNKIILEVSTSQGKYTDVVEEQSGATGSVFLAQQKVAVFDAHYGQDVLRFFGSEIQDTLTWFVESPFSPKGGTPKDTPIQLLDYKWVKFVPNLVKTRTLADGSTQEFYSKRNRWYPGDQYISSSDRKNKLMYVNELVQFLIEQKKLLEAGKENMFRKEIVNNRERDVIYVTAFIDEYYYEKTPVAQETPDRLWTKFTNECGDRMMHILCNNKVSYDKESSYTSSVYTIRQRPIQTIYSTDKNKAPDFAWGCETIDENGFDMTNGMGLNFGSSQRDNFNVLKEFGANLSVNNGTNGGKNGLYNTWKMCGFNDGVSRWDTYLNVTEGNPDNVLTWELPECYDPNHPEYVPDDGSLTPEKDNIHFIRNKNWMFSILMRNRDNNGDGKINKDEIRWYVASIDQLQSIFMGGEGLSSESQIYPEIYANYVNSKDFNDGVQKWRLHIISSTIEVNNQPKMLWAEEGLSTSNCAEWNLKGIKSIRCVRNLGMPKWTTGDTPQMYRPIVEVLQQDSRLMFDISRLNLKALRGNGVVDPFLHTLETSDEHGVNSLLPMGFEVCINATNNKANIIGWDNRYGNNTIAFDDLKHVLDNSLQVYYPEKDKFGGYWRVPNVRELALVQIFMKSAMPSERLTSATYYSLGFFGDKSPKDDKSRRTWYISNDQLTMDTSQNTQPLRFLLVRDWQP